MKDETGGRVGNQQLALLNDMLSSEVWKDGDNYFIKRKHPNRTHAIIVRVNKRLLDSLFSRGFVGIAYGGDYVILEDGVNALKKHRVAAAVAVADATRKRGT